MSIEAYAAQTLEEAFPSNIDPLIRPVGGRILVQLRRPQSKSKSGLVLISDTNSEKNWNDQVAKILALGPLAFRDRKTQEVWPEGVWANVGDFVKIPRWGGDRFSVDLGDGGDPVTLVICNDHEVIGVLTGDPLKMPIKFI